MSYKFQGELWRWTGEAPASWVFITLPADLAFEIKCTIENRRAWGSVKVNARIGRTEWQTSLFPEKATGSYLLPIKATVRKAEGLHDQSIAEVTLSLM